LKKINTFYFQFIITTVLSVVVDYIPLAALVGVVRLLLYIFLSYCNWFFELHQ